MKDMLAELQDQLKARGMIIRDLLRDRGLIEEQHQARVGRWSTSHDITGSRVCRCLVGSCRHGEMSLLEEALTNIRTLIHIWGWTQRPGGPTPTLPTLLQKNVLLNIQLCL